MLDLRLQHLELNGLPTSWNPFAGMSKEEKAVLALLDELKTTCDALKTNMDTQNPTIASLKENILTSMTCQVKVSNVESTAHMQSSHIISLENQVADLSQKDGVPLPAQLPPIPDPTAPPAPGPSYQAPPYSPWSQQPPSIRSTGAQDSTGACQCIRPRLSLPSPRRLNPIQPGLPLKPLHQKSPR